MHHSILTAALLLPALALAQSGSLPPCGPHTESGCVCPSGTTFMNTTTYVQIGGRFSDVKDIVGSFHNTDWLGVSVLKPTGSDTQIGATRSFIFGVNTKYELIEDLIDVKNTKNSHYHKYGLINAPAEIPEGEGDGTLVGYWNFFDVKGITAYGYGKRYQTSVKFSSYRCVIGNPFDYVPFFEAGLKNITTTLEKQGKLLGRSTTPYTVNNTASS